MPKRKLVCFGWALNNLLNRKENFDILEGLLSELLKEDIQIQKVLESYANEDIQRFFNQLNLCATNEQGDTVVIRIYCDTQYDYLHKIFRFSSGRPIEHPLDEISCPDIKKAISVHILMYFDPEEGSDYVYHASDATSFLGVHHCDRLQLPENALRLYQKKDTHSFQQECYLLRTESFDDIIRDPLDEWIYLLKNGEIRNDFGARGIEKAKQRLDIMKLSDKKYRAYDRYQDDLHYGASMVESTWTAGILEGKEEARNEKKAIATNLLQSGLLDIEKIAAMTGLTVEEIRSLTGIDPWFLNELAELVEAASRFMGSPGGEPRAEPESENEAGYDQLGPVGRFGRDLGGDLHRRQQPHPGGTRRPPPRVGSSGRGRRRNYPSKRVDFSLLRGEFSI